MRFVKVHRVARQATIGEANNTLFLKKAKQVYILRERHGDGDDASETFSKEGEDWSQ